MSPRRKVARQETEQRLKKAESAAETVAEKANQVERQVSLVSTLVEGWRRVHEKNHLAQLFKEDGHLG